MKSKMILNLFICFVSLFFMSAAGCGIFPFPGNNNSTQGNRQTSPPPRSGVVRPNEMSIKSQVIREADWAKIEQYQFTKRRGWMVFYRDDNGKRGTVFAALKLGSGMKNARAEFKKAIEKPVQLFHVRLHEDQPADYKFRFTETQGAEDPPAKDKDGKVLETKITLTFESTMSDTKSPYFFKSCGIPYHERKTKLIADCRCGKNRQDFGLDICRRPYTITYSTREMANFGSGPKLALLPSVHIYGGFIDKRTKEIITVVDWKGGLTGEIRRQGLLAAIDYKTGKRRIISGTYKDKIKDVHEIGKGPKLTDVREAHLGKDGNYYVFCGTALRNHIVRVDPKTGNRTLVWERDNSAFGQCPSGRGPTKGTQNKCVQIHPHGFAIDDDGSFFMSFNNNFGEGQGIIRISKDGKTCKVITRHNTNPKNPIYKTPKVGTGPHPRSIEYRGLMFKDGVLHANDHTEKRIFSIDKKTGDRKVVFDSQGRMMHYGHRWLRWDAKRKLFWSAGKNNGNNHIDLVDPEKNKAYGLFCPGTYAIEAKGVACVRGGALTSRPLNYGGIWFDPENDDILYIAHDGMAILKYEISTGNSVILSL